MGLDFSHADAHWSYSGFNRARSRLAAVLGINFDDLCDEGVLLDAEILKDPIAPLLFHSDCEGEISSKDCKAAAPRLKELIQFWPEDDFDKKQFMMLADGMEEAAKAGEPLLFS